MKHSAAAASTSGVKRTRTETAAVVDDDAFEVGPSRARSQQVAPTAAVAAEEPIWARTKQVAPASVAAAEAPGEMMDQCGICPRVLVEELKGLNDKQRWTVQSTSS